MKRDSKSAINRNVVILFLSLVVLAGCAETRWPSWLTGEPDESVLAAPRAVTRSPGPEATEWPTLGSVPTKKPVFSSQTQLKKETEELASERLKAQSEMERIRNVPLGEAEMEPAEIPIEPVVDPVPATHPFSALRP